MKTHVSGNRQEQGNVILVALVLGAIAGLTLASYLMLAQQQNMSIYRSQAWNSSMVVAEAGVEDGLQLVNLYAGSTNARDIFNWTNRAAGAGWDHPSPTVYHIQRYITNGLAPGQIPNSYEVWVYNTNNMPFVYSVGSVPWTYSFPASAHPVFAQVAKVNTTIGPQTAVRRRVGVQTHYDPLFVVAMAALSYIDLKGNNIATDSFDSADPNFSNNGHYPLGNPNKTRANGDVCTDAGVVDSLYVGNANIKGNVRTGPGTNTIYIGANGTVGDRAWVEGGNTGIQTNHSATDFNVTFNDVRLPDSPGWLPLGASSPQYTWTNGTKYSYVVSDSGTSFYKLNGFGDSMLINAPTGSVVNILVTGNVNLTGSKTITIAPTGVEVRMWMQGSSFSLTGNAIIDNQSGMAQNFYLFGLPSCTFIEFNGNGSFYGGVYAPEAAFTLGGGGNNTLDFVGASVTRTVSMNGHFNFHFDENLARVGPARGFIPVAWLEK